MDPLPPPLAFHPRMSETRIIVKLPNLVARPLTWGRRHALSRPHAGHLKTGLGNASRRAPVGRRPSPDRRCSLPIRRQMTTARAATLSAHNCAPHKSDDSPDRTEAPRRNKSVEANGAVLAAPCDFRGEL